MGPINVINIIEDVGHLERNERKIIVQLCLIKIFATSKCYSLFLILLQEVAIMSVCMVLCLHDISGHQHNQYIFVF